MEFLRDAVLVLVAVKLAGHLSRRLGQPSVLGKLLVGVVLGPALLGWLELNPIIDALSEAGVILLMFLAGLETDLGQFRRTALAATLVAVGGVALPFLGGWWLAGAWGYSGLTAVFVGVLLVATSVSISVQTLRELGRLRSTAGVTILAAAVIDDILGIVVLSLVLGLAGGGAAAGPPVALAAAAGAGGAAGPAGVAWLIGKIALFLAGATVIGARVLPPLLRWFAGFQVGAPLTAAGIAVALGLAWAAEQFGLAGIVGAYLAGLLLSTTEMQHDLFEEVEIVGFAFFVPFFFAAVGLAAEASGLAGALPFVVLLTLVAILTKVVGCAAGALLARMPRQEALGVGAGMVARGEVGLIVASIGLDRGLLTPELYTGMVVVSLVTTLVTPPMLKAIFQSHLTGAPTTEP